MANMDYPGPCPSCSAIDGCASEERRKFVAAKYCEGVEMEVNAWKARLYDVITAFDGADATLRDKLKDSVALLKSTVRELDAAIAQFDRECPASVSEVERNIGDKLQTVRVHYSKALEVVSPGSFGG